MKNYKVTNDDPFLSDEAFDKMVTEIRANKYDMIDLSFVQNATPRHIVRFFVEFQNEYKITYSPFLYLATNVIKSSFKHYCESCMTWFPEQHMICPKCNRNLFV